MKPSARWTTVAMVALCLILVGAQASFSQEPDEEYALGDVPLDEETYQKYLKVYPMSRAMALALPSAYDARGDGIVTPAKNQGSCGSCWAFASVGAMESHLQKEYAWGLEDLSEQQLLSCSGRGSCSGGSLKAPKFWRTTGPTRESCFPYTADDTTPCSDGSGCTQLAPRVVDWHTVPRTPAHFNASCYNDGPSYWRYDVYQDFEDWWKSASSGAVYTNQDTKAGNEHLGGHAVLLIGWDDDKGAYLCKNSWGSSSGPNGDGTFWIAYSGHHNDLGFQMSNFNLNQPPAADANGPYSGDEGVPIKFDGTGSTDPDDDIEEYQWDMDNDGDYDDAAGASPSYAFPDNGSYTVGLKVIDDHNQWDTDTAQVTVSNVPPVVTVDIDDQSLQYSDYICDVTFTATDVAADTMTAAATPDPLWDTLALTANACTVSSGVRTCTWTLAGTMDKQVGDYKVVVEVTDKDGGSAGEDTDVTVEHEDADIWLYEYNPVALEVDAPGSDSPAFSLTAYVQETNDPDVATCGADPGDISKAKVSMTLAAVGPGSSHTTVPCTHVGVTGTGYDAVLEVSCDFDNVAVNTYHVQTSVIGDYYAGGPDEDVLVVYDPSLGFTTGGGWFYWPDTTDKTSFGYTMKYLKNRKRIQGSLLLIRHLDDGTDRIYRVKSNALYGLALGEFGDPAFGWASFGGKCTYKDKDWVEPEGNHVFLVYLEDHGEPGAGADQFWIEVHDKKGDVIVAMSMDRDATDNTETLGGGNIVVPHTPGSLKSQ